MDINILYGILAHTDFTICQLAVNSLRISLLGSTMPWRASVLPISNTKLVPYATDIRSNKLGKSSYSWHQVISSEARVLFTQNEWTFEETLLIITIKIRVDSLYNESIREAGSQNDTVNSESNWITVLKQPHHCILNHHLVFIKILDNSKVNVNQLSIVS